MLTKGLLMFVLKKCHFNEALIIYTINLYENHGTLRYFNYKSLSSNILFIN